MITSAYWPIAQFGFCLCWLGVIHWFIYQLKRDTETGTVGQREFLLVVSVALAVCGFTLMLVALGDTFYAGD